MARKKAGNRQIAVGNFTDVSGDVNIATGDIIKNINTIYQRALTAAEEAAQARKLENELLAQGIATLMQSLAAQAGEGIHSDSPYKGLLPYGLNDAEIFYGRSKAKRDLLACIKRSSLTVLHAESGAGKSSLLQAGIAVELISNDHLAVYLRPYHADPVEFIKRMFLPELNQASALASGSLRDFLRQVCSVLGSTSRLYLLLDQFEEFFQLKKNERHPFLQSLADCLNDPSLNVRWILTLRKEALSDLAELELYGITQFKNTYRLNRLSREEAQEAIVEPARQHRIKFESDLIEHILDTLVINGEVRPTHLQLICSALTDNLLEDKTLTLAYYTEHESGTEGILRDYLKRQLEDMPPREQALAWKVLRALITADHQRAVKTNDEIVHEIKTSSVSKKQIETMLSRLVERRLLFTQTQSTIEKTFELAHDYLIKEIELDPQEQARKAAQELLDQETRTFQRHRTLLSPERLAVIEPYQNELRFSEEAKELLTKSRFAILAAKHRRSRILMALSTIAVVVTIGMSILAFNASRQAKTSRARELAAQSVELRENNFRLSLLLGIEAFRTFETLRTRGNLLDAAKTNPQLLQFLSGPTLSISSVAFSPDGTKLASGGTAGIILWDVNTRQQIGELLHREARYVLSVAFSPDGTKLASGSDSGTVILWNVDTLQQIGEPLQGHTSLVLSVAFSPDGTKLASVSDSGTVILWNVDTLQQIGEPLHRDLDYGLSVLSVAFSPDGTKLASGGELGAVVVWDVNTHQQIGATIKHTSYVLSVAFSPDGTKLALGGAGGITLWNADTLQQIGEPLKGHTSLVLSVAFSPDGTKLASGSEDRTIILWDVGTHQPISEHLHGHTSSVSSVAFSPDGITLASGSKDGVVILWNVDTKHQQIGEPFKGNTGYVSSVVFSPDGATLASGSDDGITMLWDVDTYQQIGILLQRDGHSVKSVAFSPDGTKLASGSTDGTITLWNVDARQQIGEPIRGDTGYVLSVAFSPDGATLASGSEDDAVILWNVDTHQQVGELLHGEASYVSSIAFSPDGTKLASVSDDGTVILWDIDARQQISKLTQRYNSILASVAFSPDGTKLASSSVDGTIILWNVDTSQQIGEPVQRDTYSVGSVAFSPDGVTLASGSDDGIITLWDVETHQQIGEPIQRAIYPVKSVAFSPDGTKLAAGSTDGNIMLWEMSMYSWFEKSCQRSGRNFTRNEWARYFPNEKYRKTCEQWPLEPEITP
jgi:WD40 repeat protein